MESQDILNLQEAYLQVYENVSGGRAKRASSKRAPIPQRVTDSQAQEIRANARNNPRPSSVAPIDNSLDAMKQRFKDEIDAEKVKEPTTVPSKGVKGDDPLLRRRTPEGHRKRGASPVAVAKRRARVLSTGHDITHGYTTRPTPESKERSKKIRAALKKADKWGTPEAANEEYVINYLISEGYSDNYESAIAIYESMSDKWFYNIIE